MKLLIKIVFAIGSFMIGCLIGINLLDSHLESSKSGVELASKSNNNSNMQPSSIYYNQIGDLVNNSESQPPEEESTNAHLFSLQLGEVKSESRAELYLDRLEKLGLPDGFYTPIFKNDRSFYQLRYGTFSTKKDATVVAKKLLRDLKYKSTVILLD